MQHAQHSFTIGGTALLGAAALLFAANLALASTVANKPDPLLNPAPGPCAGLAGGPDYVAGADADGHPVVPADVDAAPVPVPEAIAIPLHGGQVQSRGGRGPSQATGTGDRPYVTLDGRRLAPLLNPPSCR